MEIVIRSYLAVSHLLEHEPEQWDAIVILDSKMAESEFVKQRSQRHLFLWFDDVTRDARGKRIPATQDIQAACEFAAESKKLVVSCRAGQSRSSAIAFAVAFQRLGDQEARNLLNPKRHAPNELVIQLAEMVVNDPLFYPAYQKWRWEHRSHRLVDYLDEIVEEIDDLKALGAADRIGSRP